MEPVFHKGARRADGRVLVEAQLADQIPRLARFHLVAAEVLEDRRARRQQPAPVVELQLDRQWIEFGQVLRVRQARDGGGGGVFLWAGGCGSLRWRRLSLTLRTGQGDRGQRRRESGRRR